jgi:fatty-acyl-CoA synthase
VTEPALEVAALSYARGPELPILERTISQVFRETVEEHPDGEALVVRHQNLRFTWSELAAEVDRTARGLLGLGLEPGDRVGV